MEAKQTEAKGRDNGISFVINLVYRYKGYADNFWNKIVPQNPDLVIAKPHNVVESRFYCIEVTQTR